MANGPGRPSKQEKRTVQDLASQASQYADSIREGNNILNSLFQTEDKLLTITEEILTKSGKKLKVDQDIGEAAVRALKAQDSINDSLKEQFGGAVDLAEKFQQISDIVKIAALNPFTAIVSLISIAVISAIKFQKAIADTRKDLGVSALEAIKLNAAFKGLEVAGKAFGLEAEDFKASFQAAREDLGASADEALNLSFSLAKAAMESGTTADQLTKVLSVLESVSSASRDTLLATIETNRRLIEQAGLAPADIFRDIANNSEFFAEFAKEGSNNLVQAGIAAKKLGLNLDAVKNITESLLNFEQSIEGQLEASLLLGSVNVEQLSRLVRNNTAGGAAGAVGAAVAGAGNTSNDPETHRLLGQLVRNTS